MKIGEEFRLFNHIDGEFKVKIVEINKHNLQIIVVDKLRDVVRDNPLILALCIIKADRFIEAIKAAVQLGVSEIIPIISERTQNKVINHARLERCIIESVEQSERFIPPLLHNPMELDKFCNFKSIDQIIFANEEESDRNTILAMLELGDKNAANPLKPKLLKPKLLKPNPALLVGPEGGFSSREKQMLALNDKILSVTLGSTVLKSEVAAIALIACIKLMMSKL